MGALQGGLTSKSKANAIEVAGHEKVASDQDLDKAGVDKEVEEEEEDTRKRTRRRKRDVINGDFVKFGELREGEDNGF